MDQEVQKALDAKFKSLNDGFEKVQQDLADAQEKGATKEELQKLITTVKTVGDTLEAFVEEQKNKQVETVLDQLSKFLVDNKSELERIKSSRSGEIKFTPRATEGNVVKAVENITTGSGTDAETAPVNHHTQLGNFNLRNDNDMLSLMSVTSTSTSNASYTELTPKEGNYAFVAEGTKKPQIDFKWENRFPEPKKIAAFEVLTEEAVTDVVRLMSVAKDFLKQKHDLFKVDACFFADGTGTLPTGATVYGRTFVAGAMALKVTTPNFMDVVNAAVTDIFTTHNYVDEMEYKANVVLLNPVDFYIELVSAKDGNGLPLYPQAGLFSTVTIGGITIKPWSKIPAGKIFVADMTKYNLVNYIPFSIRIGWINEQFVENTFTMLGESRFFQYVKNLDQQAFIYDDIATIATAITKP